MNTRSKGMFLVIFGVFLMSFESLIIKATKSDIFSITMYFGLFLALSSFLISLKNGLKTTKKSFSIEKKALFTAAFCMAFANFFFFYSVKYIGITITVLIYATCPILTAILESIIYKTRAGAMLYITSLIIIFGLFIAIKDNIKFDEMLNIFFCLIGLICFSIIYIVLSNKKEVDRKSVITLCGLMLFFFALPFANTNINLQDFCLLFFMGFFLTSISRLAIGYGAMFILGAEVTLICVLESILAPIWGHIILGEIVNLDMIIGGTISIFAIICYISMKTRYKISY
ncbi:DMT family transporter [Campylobacter sputorum]|uniref:DMT family transporter n=1 Tax=Campylobacter sputorum TaxID=206 RepID=UPI001E45007F|nr:DMT family transporter [Campylobacter sputorum]